MEITVPIKVAVEGSGLVLRNIAQPSSVVDWSVMVSLIVLVGTELLVRLLSAVAPGGVGATLIVIAWEEEPPGPVQTMV